MTGIFSYLVFFACIVLILGILTLGLNLQWGFTGLFNAGIVGFYAIGAYTHAMSPEQVTQFAIDQQRTWKPIAEKVARETPQ